MELTFRELWTVIHGMLLGAVYLLAFAGGLEGLWSMRPGWNTDDGASKRIRRVMVGTWTMALVAWLTVIVGTYIVYPWYRAPAPKDTPSAQLVQYPRALLISRPQTAGWHNFGMEWKEHIAWLAPILATAVAVIVTRYRKQLTDDARLRQALLLLFVVSFFAAAAAGVFGAFINKAASIR